MTCVSKRTKNPAILTIHTRNIRAVNGGTEGYVFPVFALQFVVGTMFGRFVSVAVRQTLKLFHVHRALLNVELRVNPAASLDRLLREREKGGRGKSHGDQ